MWNVTTMWLDMELYGTIRSRLFVSYIVIIIMCLNNVIFLVQLCEKELNVANQAYKPSVHSST